MQIFGQKIRRVKFWANIISDISSDQNALDHLSRKTSPNQEKIQNKKHLQATNKRQKNNLKPRKKKRKTSSSRPHRRWFQHCCRRSPPELCCFCVGTLSYSSFHKKVFLNRSGHLGIEMPLAVVVQRKQVVFFGHVAPVRWQGGQRWILVKNGLMKREKWKAKSKKLPYGKWKVKSCLMKATFSFPNFSPSSANVSLPNSTLMSERQTWL